MESQEAYVRNTMDDWWRGSNSINILVTGKTGTGKSSLVNSILGKNVAIVGEDLHPQTVKVSSFSGDIDGIKVMVWDSPGLQDGLNDEVAYLQDIERCCKNKIDLFIYCVSMQNTRFVEGNRDIDSMCKLTDKLGKEVWNNSVFVLTCANQFISKTRSTMVINDATNMKVKEAFDERLEEWKARVRECLQKKLHLSPETIQKMPILPAGRKQFPLLLEGFSVSPWLSELWMGSLLVTKHRAQPALIKMNHNRLIFVSGIIHSEKEFQELLSKEKIIIGDRATEFERAKRAGRGVGRTSGYLACLAHIFERIFITLGEEICVLAAELFGRVD